ncbi:MAG: hypothetical protein GVY24_00890 [Planctomycetes bacterium]|jgi:membrane protein|nr:hypothetical protein [Planctomycetota bacterium]
MATWVGIIARRTANFLARPGEELTQWQRMARYVLELARHCGQQLYEHRANQMAAALTYHTLFSLIPTMVLMLVVGRLFVGEAELETFRESTINYVLQWLQESAGAAASGVEAQSAGGNADFSSTAQAVSDQIDDWFRELQQVNFGAIGAVGVLLFLYGATGLVTTIERSFNRIYDAPGNRPLHIRLPMYYTVITLGPLLLALGQYLQNLLFGWLYGGLSVVSEQLNEVAGDAAESDAAAGNGAATVPESFDQGAIESAEIGWLGEALMNIVIFLSPLVSTWLVIAAIYFFLPNTKVKIKPALIGSFVAAIGAVAAIELFGLYVRGAAVTTLYGPLALLPLFLLFLYVLWLVVLFGLELTNTLQTLPGERMKKRTRGEDEDLVIDPNWVIPALAVAADAFSRGEKVTPDTLAQRTALPSRVTTRLAHHLHEVGLLNRVEESNHQYCLAQPAETLPLKKVLDAGRSLTPGHPTDCATPGVALLHELDEHEDQSLEGRTLAEVLRESEDHANQ